DDEQPDKKFGGDLQIGDVHYFVYASKVFVPPKSTSKAPEPSPAPAPPTKGPPPAPWKPPPQFSPPIQGFRLPCCNS
ncbi:MAG: hypothetical protein L6R42_011595, partial [Xanthoria sp. 1 TBL-2021]